MDTICLFCGAERRCFCFKVEPTPEQKRLALIEAREWLVREGAVTRTRRASDDLCAAVVGPVMARMKAERATVDP